jgi:hypothetical protein
MSKTSQVLEERIYDKDDCLCEAYHQPRQFSDVVWEVEVVA